MNLCTLAVGRLSILGLVICSTLVLGCAADSTAPLALVTSSPAENAHAGVQPLCVEGCLDPDPDPSAPGIYIPGTLYTASGCAEFGADQDYDGLADECEWQLAIGFAPMLSFNYGDDVNREPRFAARWRDDSTVAVMYLLSYWMDNGAPVTCPPGDTSGCHGHVGDSEYLRFDLRYSATSGHWRLVYATLSKHEDNWHCDVVVNGSAVLCVDSLLKTGFLSFPYHPNAAPKIFVSDGKHANYPTDAACDAGGFHHSDECDSPRYEVALTFSQYDNIGSRSVPLIDATYTANPAHPVYALHYVEYYWTWKRFRGWFNDNGDSYTSAYTDILANNGF